MLPAEQRLLWLRCGLSLLIFDWNLLSTAMVVRGWAYEVYSPQELHLVEGLVSLKQCVNELL